MKKDILSLLPEELENEIVGLGMPKFRARQISEWLYKGIRDFSLMTNIPVAMREMLSNEYFIYEPEIIDKRISSDGTYKYLWKLRDGNAVETVLMQYSYGNTICVSTQVGCRQGCAFCASTIGGLVRSLDAYEILDEVIFTQFDSGLKVSNVVLMGIGEPLDNFDNVVRFIKLLTHPQGLNIGMRHITLSTCGITEKFADLANLNFPITLTISLHAPDDETRSKLMPTNRSRGIDSLISSCVGYYKSTNRRISFEYAMIKNVNDSLRQAELLADIALKCKAHVNLIPLNFVKERNLYPSEPSVIDSFELVLKRRGVNVTVRRKLGNDVNASCGQLRRNYIGNEEK